MANCNSCSAPLLGKSNVCEYCGRLNDTNLHGIHQYTIERPNTDRSCPRCEVALHTINLKKQERFFIERCDQCMGLFFDPNELEVLLEQSVSNVFQIDKDRLNEVNKELYYHDKNHAMYIKCPVCTEFMKRTNFGAKSGVIIDCCQTHGVWLDGGELKRLLEWKKAGGQLLHEKISQEQKEQDAKQSKKRDINQFDNNWLKQTNDDGWHRDDDVVTSVFRLFDKIF